MTGRFWIGAVCALSLVFTSACGAAKPAAAEGKEKVMAPAAVAKLMKAAKMDVKGVYRKGGHYAVKARGPSGNEVMMNVNGRSGAVEGLDVTKWAKGAKRVKRGSRGKKFAGDVYEFGAVVAVAALATWIAYEEAAWLAGPEWIEVVSEDVVWTDCYYEEGIVEVSYEDYEVEYAEAYDVSLDETVESYETVETSYEESYESAEAVEVTETAETWSESSETETTDVAETVDDGGQADDGADQGGADDGGGADDAGGYEDGGGDAGGDDAGGDEGGGDYGSDDGGGDDGGGDYSGGDDGGGDDGGGEE